MGLETGEARLQLASAARDDGTRARAEGASVENAGWSPEAWIEQFRAASSRGDGRTLRRLRAQVFQGTAEAVRARGYRCYGKWIDLDHGGRYEALWEGTAFHPETEGLAVPEAKRGAFRTRVAVRTADCLDVARELAREEAGDAEPAVLNMASRRNPGGGVLQGSGAQEENLFRRTNLLHSLYRFIHYGPDYGVPPDPEGRSYPIPRECGGIYSPHAVVFRSSEPTGYAFLSEPWQAAFLTVPAISHPETVRRDGRAWLTEEMAEATRRKIRAIFRIAAAHGHVDLVLSAFGCGAFRNPPQHVARLFREVLAEPELSGVFRTVVFAVIDDHNAVAPEGNYAAFVRELGGS